MRLYTCNVYDAAGDFQGLCYVPADGPKAAAVKAVGRMYGAGYTTADALQAPFRVDVSTSSAPGVVTSIQVEHSAIWKGTRDGN